MKTKNFIIFSICILFSFHAMGKKHIVLTLDRAISMAADSSLSSFEAKNSYMASYWAYKSFRANRLPSLDLVTTPIHYKRNFVSRYDSQNDIDIYRSQKSYYASGGLKLSQNLDLTGGTFYVQSDLDYLKYYGESNSEQFSSVPIKIGYSHSTLGYNAFKWEKQIEPLKYKEAKKQLIYNLQNIAVQTTYYFFALASAQVSYKINKDKISSSNTLYEQGQKRNKIGSISRGDLLTLKLDVINAKNSFRSSQKSLDRAMSNLISYLNLDENEKVTVVLPEALKNINIDEDKALEMVQKNNPDFINDKRSILEAKKTLEKTIKTSRLQASINASIGFNQVASNLSNSYNNLLEQDIVSLSLSIPILDWGESKGNKNMAANNLNVIKLQVEQSEQSTKEDIIITVRDFNDQQDMINSAKEAMEIADLAYSTTEERFKIGEADISSLTLAQNRKETAKNNYIQILEDYWAGYYKLRKLTLYDFDMKAPISFEFETLYKF